QDGGIFWSSFSHGLWLEQQQITPTSGGTPETSDAPAIAVTGQTVHVVWRGETTNQLGWSAYTDGKWSPQQILFPDSVLRLTDRAPFLVTDGGGGVWLSWVVPPGTYDGVLILGNLLYFSSLGAGNQWRAPAKQQSTLQPASAPSLISTSDSSQD